MTQLPTYVINLDGRTDRWSAMLPDLNRLGLNVERISAIDKLSLSADQATRWMGAGHVACARSHYKALSAFLDTQFPVGLILEDDVEVGDVVSTLLGSAEWWVNGHGLVKLESTFTCGDRIWLGSIEGQTPDGRSLRTIMHSHLGAYGYMIDRRTASDVIKNAPVVPLPIDHLLFNLSNSVLARRARPLQLVPGAIRHRPREQFGSDMGTSRIRGRKLWKKSRTSRAFHKLKWLSAVMAGRAKLREVRYVAGDLRCSK